MSLIGLVGCSNEVLDLLTQRVNGLRVSVGVACPSAGAQPVGSGEEGVFFPRSPGGAVAIASIHENEQEHVWLTPLRAEYQKSLGQASSAEDV
jgi:hypothetical protein